MLGRIHTVIWIGKDMQRWRQLRALGTSTELLSMEWKLRGRLLIAILQVGSLSWLHELFC